MDIINNMINDQFFKNPILVEERFFWISGFYVTSIYYIPGSIDFIFCFLLNSKSIFKPAELQN